MPRHRDDLAELERQRAELYGELSRVGDFRRGGVHEVRRKCGKPNCARASLGHPGHGPQYNWTRSVGGKTVNVHLKPGPELDKISAEVANYERFRELVGEVTEVNETICDTRPVSPLAGTRPSTEGSGAEKGGSSRRSRRSTPPR
ncbi:MAG: DUF6788 family protein [Acidimicrobiales bacterium]